MPSRIAFQIPVEAVSSMISAVPNPATSFVSEAARLAADAGIPSSRSSVAACPCEASAASADAATGGLGSAPRRIDQELPRMSDGLLDRSARPLRPCGFGRARVELNARSAGEGAAGGLVGG